MNSAPAANADGYNAIKISDRAGWFLEINHHGAHKDKRIARALGISLAMARLLRAGRGWTVARLDQCTTRWPNFHAFVFARTDQPDRIDRVLEEIAALRVEINDLKMGKSASDLGSVVAAVSQSGSDGDQSAPAERSRDGADGSRGTADQPGSGARQSRVENRAAA
jgi:hypothetical protein